MLVCAVLLKVEVGSRGDIVRGRYVRDAVELAGWRGGFVMRVGLGR